MTKAKLFTFVAAGLVSLIHVACAKPSKQAVSPEQSEGDAVAATPSQDDMPLIWPVLARAELPAAEEPAESTIRLEYVLALLAGAFALAAMIAERILKRSAARPPRPPAARDRVHLAAPTTEENAGYLDAKRDKLGHLFAN